MSSRRNNLLRLPSARARIQPASPLAAFGELLASAEALQARGQPAEAVGLYRRFIATDTQGLAHAAGFNLGVLLTNGGKLDEAIDAYRDAIARKPDFLEPRINLGSLLEVKGCTADALAIWAEAADADAQGDAARRALQVQALNHIGRVRETHRDYPGAEAALRRSLELAPQQPDVIQHWVHLRQKQCKWPVFQPLPGLTVADMLAATSPLAMLAHTDDPSLQLLASDNFVRRKLNVAQGTLAAGRRYDHARLRIGYLSGDLCVHAVGLLLADLLGQHDRTQFETYAFDFSRDDGTPYQARLRQAFEHRHPVGGLGDAQAAQLIADCEIDVLVDLQGLSAGTRPGILALRPAPVQVGWLGFIGSSAMPWIDYVIGDRFALTADMQPYFTEQLLHMDAAFLPRDSQREQGAPTTRAEHGLPDDKFVFASFNNAYKLNPEMFAAWMAILRRVPDSVLWLLDDNPAASDNLRRAAERAGVGSERLVFAQRTGYADFVSRLQLADLFLDNHPYNAGSTAQDALCAGLPMLTLSGRSFVSRMAGSVLLHAGLPELVTFSHADYIDAAVALAGDREQLVGIRRRVAAAGRERSQASVQARALEDVLLQAAGRAPRAAAPDRAEAAQALARRADATAPLAQDERAAIHRLPAAAGEAGADTKADTGADTGADTDAAWRHREAVRAFLRAAHPDEQRLVGFLPADCSRQCGLDAAELLARVRALPADTDACAIALPGDAGEFFLNVFEPVEAFDPGFTAEAARLLAEAGIEVALAALVMDSRQSVTGPWLLARPAFWRAWLALSDALDAARRTEAAPRDAVRAARLQERLAAVLLAVDPAWHAQRLSAFADGGAAAARQALPGAGVLIDALKLAIRATGRADFVAAFAAQRERLLQQPPQD